MKPLLAIFAIAFLPITVTAQVVDSEDGGVQILKEQTNDLRTFTAYNTRSETVCVMMSVRPSTQQNVSFHFDSLRLGPGERYHIGQIWQTDSRVAMSFDYDWFWRPVGHETCP